MNLNREFLDEKFNNRVNKIANVQLAELQIKHVDKETFIGLDNLHSIDLSRNEIKHLDKNTFNSVSNVREIWLNNNLLETLDKDMFVGLRDLRAIYLHDNNFTCEKLELNLEEGVQYVTFNNGWRNDFLSSSHIDNKVYLSFSFFYDLKVNDSDNFLLNIYRTQ